MRTWMGLGLAALVALAGGCGDDGDTSPEATVEAAFSVTPDEGTRLTDFEFDAGSSLPSGQGLEFRWDWEGDGTWDTDWSTSTAAGHRYSLYQGSAIDTLDVTLEARKGARHDTVSAEIAVDARHGHIVESLPLELPDVDALGTDGAYLWTTEWHAYTGHGALHKIDPATGDTLLSLATPDLWPGGVTSDGEHLCTVGYLKLWKLDPVTGAEISHFDVVYSAYSAGLAWDGESFFYGSWKSASGGDGHIHKYAADGTHLLDFPSPHGSETPHGVAYDGQHLWVTTEIDDSLFVVDPATGSVLTSVHVASDIGPVTVLGDYVWCVSTEMGRHLVRIVP